jgi:hypothetical protein
MNLRTPLIRAGVAALLVGAAFTLERVPVANASPTASSASPAFSIDADAPVRVTLLPEVHVTASGARVADEAPLVATLLPTVHVVASATDVAGGDAPVPVFASDLVLLAAK